MENGNVIYLIPYKDVPIRNGTENGEIPIRPSLYFLGVKMMKTLMVKQVELELVKLIGEVIRSYEVVRIEHVEGKVVLLSEEEYDGLLETLELLLLPGLRESLERSVKQIENGEVYSMEELFGQD